MSDQNNIYDVCLLSHGRYINVNDIEVDNGGDHDDAICEAIDKLRSSGIKGCIEYISHDVRAA